MFSPLICDIDMQGLVKRETRFTSKCSPNEIISKIEETAKPLGFNVRKRNYKVTNIIASIIIFEYFSQLLMK